MMGYGYMGGGGLIWWLIAALLLVVPFWKILPRHGLPAWLSLAAIFPLFALVLLWVVAFKEDSTGDGGGIS